MPVVEGKFEHVRIRKRLARRLRKVAVFFHRRGIQTDTNLAVEEYVEKYEKKVLPKM